MCTEWEITSSFIKNYSFAEEGHHLHYRLNSRAAERNEPTWSRPVRRHRARERRADGSVQLCSTLVRIFRHIGFAVWLRLYHAFTSKRTTRSIFIRVKINDMWICCLHFLYLIELYPNNVLSCFVNFMHRIMYIALIVCFFLSLPAARLTWWRQWPERDGANCRSTRQAYAVRSGTIQWNLILWLTSYQQCLL